MRRVKRYLARPVPDVHAWHIHALVLAGYAIGVVFGHFG